MNEHSGGYEGAKARLIRLREVRARRPWRKHSLPVPGGREISEACRDRWRKGGMARKRNRCVDRESSRGRLA